MKQIRFLMIGGFLGAGKTTTIGRMARAYTDQGLNVGLVTNDQAYDLVDTESLRRQGFHVGEVPGACFCCKFDDLVDTMARLSADDMPDIVIAEPVGSCTDLVATVIEPLRQIHGDRYEIGRLAVLLKPEHGQKILREEGEVGFSPKAAYIFLKQIEEADVVVLNKIDKLTAAEREEIVGLINTRFPSKEVIAISARESLQLDLLLEALERPAEPHTKFMEVDYDVYAEGEAELGWLNCQVAMQAPAGEKRSLDRIVTALVTRIRDLLGEQSIEPAHLKVMGQAGVDMSIANLVDSGSAVENSLAAEVDTGSIELIVNARVAGTPETLEAFVTQAAADVAGEFGLTYEVTGMQRFRPGRPVPTHRVQ